MQQHLDTDLPTFSDSPEQLFLSHDLPLLQQGKLIIPTSDPLFEMQFQRMIVTDNRGSIINPQEYLSEGAPKLNNNSFGKDTNPRSKPLPEEFYCESCKVHQNDTVQKSGTTFSRCTGCRRVRYCGSECQLNHWPEHKANCLIECEVIFTFTYKKLTGQNIHNVFLKKSVTEEEFVTTILETIPVHAPNYHDLCHLVRISTCTNYNMADDKGKKMKADCMLFRERNNGKYFFSQKYENTIQSKIWAKWLAKYISLRSM